MKSNYNRLGDYIEPVDEKNIGNKIKELQGISNKKYFQKAKTNTIGVDLSTYRIVRKGQFAFNRATTRNSEKISIALRKNTDCIVSPSYRIFRSKNEEKLNSEYLLMWFRRPEFDRYARFKSHGSAHEFFDYDEMCDVELPIPSPTKQREIVDEYNTVQNRIDLNNKLIQNLEETAQAIYKEWFVDEAKEFWENVEIKNYGNVITGKTPSSKCPEDFGDEMSFVTPGDFKNYNKFTIGAERKLSKIGFLKLKNKTLPPKTVIVTCIGSDMGKVAIVLDDCITNQQMNSIVVNKSYYSDYLYYYLKSVSVELKGIALGGSTMPMLSKSDFEKIKVIKPSDDILMNFESVMKPINIMNMNYSLENRKLSELTDLLLSKLATKTNR
jgi:type I restriction enzyme S subunit